MYIHITGKTNKPYIMLNICWFKLESGTIIGIDRQESSFSIDENGNIDLTFLKCYLWSIDDEYPFSSEPLIDDSSFLKNAEFIEMEIEDDADDDYEFKIESIEWGD